MSLLRRCDSCAAEIPPGRHLDDGAMVSVVAYRIGATEPLCFCGWGCLASYAAGRAGTGVIA